uniref:Truncated accessory protein 3c n=1 Tax=Feline coronavirus TaxID=12663 RepID=C5IGA7_9ALPC|nr:truncated accessory protein 3c [Feline coronavirus]
MIGGLFLNTLSFIVTNQHVIVNNTPHFNFIVQQHMLLVLILKFFIWSSALLFSLFYF